jgi:hypothetical protein
VIHDNGKGRERQFWSNKHGWISVKREADHYTQWEKGTVDLPIGGRWEKV